MPNVTVHVCLVVESSSYPRVRLWKTIAEWIEAGADPAKAPFGVSEPELKEAASSSCALAASSSGAATDSALLCSAELDPIILDSALLCSADLDPMNLDQEVPLSLENQEIQLQQGDQGGPFSAMDQEDMDFLEQPE